MRNYLNFLVGDGSEVPKVFMGTLAIGARSWDGVNDKQSRLAVDAAIDRGLNSFDTAIQYGRGHAEKILAEQLQNTNRHKVFIATKIAPTAHRAAQVVACCEQSLKNLHTDYIDLLQIHWPSGCFGDNKIPLAETMAAFEDLKKQGKIRMIGVCNFDLLQLQQATIYAKISSVQNNYSLLCQDGSLGLLDYCRSANISFLAYSPLAQGLLSSSKQVARGLSKQDMRYKNPVFSDANATRVSGLRHKLNILADQYNCSINNLAIAWLLAQDNITPIVGLRTAAHVNELCDFLSEEIQYLPCDLVSKLSVI